MGIMVGLPSPSGSEKDLQLNFGKNMTVQVEMRAPHLPAEWHTQSGIQLTWPHAGTDWAYMLTEVQECFINIAREIAERELLLIVTPEPEAVREQIASSVNIDNVRFLECETNDTWEMCIRDRPWCYHHDRQRHSFPARLHIQWLGVKVCLRLG
mgnify:CR=1 FL=1